MISPHETPRFPQHFADFRASEINLKKVADFCCGYPNDGFKVTPSTAIKPKKNGKNTMSNQIITTGPLGVRVTSSVSFGAVEHEVNWKRGSASLVFAANEGKVEINWRLIKEDEDSYLKLPRTVWSWLENFQNGGFAERVASKLINN